MPALVLSSSIWGDMFGTAEMRALFADGAMMQRYLDVEVALAKVQAELEIIPAAAADAIAASADVARIDWQHLQARTAVVGYPILPLVEQLSSWAPDGLGQWCHYGATTQDIMDTADVLQMRAALDLLEVDLAGIAAALATLARDHAATPMAGRTHLQHALPVSFGYKAATWLSGIERHRQRLAELRPRLEVVQFAGAAGTLASLGAEKGLATQSGLAAALALGTPDITWHAIRDGFVEATGWLALTAASIGKIGYDIMLMMQTEVGEVLEPYQAGRGASSTMPQKRNPIASEVMLAASKIVREQHSAMLDAMVQDHERATGQWHVEWQALPTAFVVASAGLRAARETLEGLEVRPDQMQRVLDQTGGLIVAEAVMMGLAPTMGRQIAHDVVQESTRRVLTEGMQFVDALAADARVTAHLDRDALAELVDPARYLGAAPEMTGRVLRRFAKGQG